MELGKGYTFPAGGQPRMIPVEAEGSDPDGLGRSSESLVHHKPTAPFSFCDTLEVSQSYYWAPSEDQGSGMTDFTRP
jgi:hypothetical protein